MAHYNNERLMITPEEAESLLKPGDTVHNYVGTGSLLVGCDYNRADALARFKTARSMEIGGEMCQSMGHGLVMIEQDGHISFFEADKNKVAAFEAAHLPPAKVIGG